MTLFKSIAKDVSDQPLNENESVIYSSDDPNDPEVLVQGVGRYKLSTLKQNVLAKLKDMAGLHEVLKRDNHEEDWSSLNAMWNHEAAKLMVKTINAAYQEMKGKA